MNPFLNTTEDYHRTGLDSLGWELTVCNALSREGGPCRRILARRESYGTLLYRHLSRLLPMESVSSVLEAGGGYGYLMRDFLTINPRLRATMLDISPRLLERQRETLRDFTVEFVPGDFFAMEDGFFRRFDLIILNEIAGDFPAACDVPTEVLSRPDARVDGLCERVRALFHRYDLERPAAPSFNFNLGALEALERICRAGVDHVFVGEHSCEARVPDELRDLITQSAPGFPERIRLRGHHEYTVKFSHLESVARAHGYDVTRGMYADFLKVHFTGEVRFILASRAAVTDEHEAIRQFVEDLYTYEYMLIRRCRGETAGPGAGPRR
jgi:hypothetical protein